MDEQQHEHLTQTLLSLEDRAWQALTRGAGADFYQGNLTDADGFGKKKRKKDEE